MQNVTGFVNESPLRLVNSTHDFVFVRRDICILCYAVFYFN